MCLLDAVEGTLHEFDGIVAARFDVLGLQHLAERPLPDFRNQAAFVHGRRRRATQAPFSSFKGGGMPRGGVVLLEKLLAANPDVENGKERNGRKGGL